MKNTSVWECQQCGSQSPKWAGRCPECGAWNSLVETVATAPQASSSASVPVDDVRPRDWRTLRSTSAKLHVPTGIAELDRVLGGGLVPGGVILIAGEPGIGKSTLLSQLALRFGPSLYVNGEESSLQVAARLRRLDPASMQRITLFPQTAVEPVVAEFGKRWKLAIVDSIQVMSSVTLRSAAGSVSQIRESAYQLIRSSKKYDIPVVIVGHFTKEGEVAGPKVLEHMVDTVLVMEGDRSGAMRVLRSLKNRFGPVDEIGLFAMEDGGMKEVVNPSEFLIGEHAGKASGSVLGCVLEGQRPLVLEVQALTVPSKLSVPRRVGQGINERRLQLLCAVIERHLGLGIGEKDVFVNVAGGLTSQDPGLDLAVVGAVVSSVEKNGQNGSTVGMVKKTTHQRSLTIQPFSHSAIPILCGEVGLLGEVRNVQGWERREKEVKRLKVGRLVGKRDLTHIRGLVEYVTPLA